MTKIVGIVAEYNPFHNGHLYQIKKIKEKYPDSLIVVCLSSVCSQRGELSILSPYEKAQIALNHDVDLVIELPYIFTVQGSDIFAKYALKLLNQLKVDTLCFGTENKTIDHIIDAAKTQLYDITYDDFVKKYLDKGLNYPTALNKALKDIIHVEISEPNELLALSYIKEIFKNNYSMVPFNIKRTTKYHDTVSEESIVSAKNIRQRIKNNTTFENKVPNDSYLLLKNKIFNNKYFEYLKYRILSETDLEKYLDVDEGLDSRLKKVINKSNTLDELILNIKSKRYTYNKISRMLNHILFSLTKDENNSIKDIEYIRILGFSTTGQQYLNEIKGSLKYPILNKYDTNKYKTLNIEDRANLIYSLIYDDIMEEEIKNKPIIKK